jgi:aspartyl-tRNA(Asn)/glutamyl-tRNA(Gln) amidotransferase subunit C
MAKLTKSEVLHVAGLAKIDLDNKEVEKYTKQLSDVVDYFGQLSEVDTKNVEPTSQTTGLENVFRTDEVKSENCLSQDAVVAGSDKIFNGYFKVKAILTERTDK